MESLAGCEKGRIDGVGRAFERHQVRRFNVAGRCRSIAPFPSVQGVLHGAEAARHERSGSFRQGGSGLCIHVVFT